jgi:hypothetical protein
MSGVYRQIPNRCIARPFTKSLLQELHVVRDDPEYLRAFSFQYGFIDSPDHPGLDQCAQNRRDVYTLFGDTKECGHTLSDLFNCLPALHKPNCSYPYIRGSYSCDRGAPNSVDHKVLLTDLVTSDRKKAYAGVVVQQKDACIGLINSGRLHGSVHSGNSHPFVVLKLGSALLWAQEHVAMTAVGSPPSASFSLTDKCVSTECEKDVPELRALWKRKLDYRSKDHN